MAARRAEEETATVVVVKEAVGEEADLASVEMDLEVAGTVKVVAKVVRVV